MSGQWPLTGRAEELRFIAGVAAAHDGPGGVVLAGAAGVGKTRLAREALAAARQHGAVTRWVAATATARALPLGAVAGLLGTADPDPARLVQSTIDVLLADAHATGVVVGVDDAHLLDELSAVLVHQLALRRAATIVLTLRTGEPAPAAVTELWKDRHLARLELQALSEPETGALLEAVLGGPVDRMAVAGMWALTRGNALFLRHLVEGELESGRLHETRGVWRWSARHATTPVLAELVDARMGRLSDPVRDVVDVLALGEPLGVTLLGMLTDPMAVELAETTGLVQVVRGGRRLEARLAHPLYGEVRRNRMGQLRTRRLRGEIATALAGTGGRRADDILRRAALTLDSDLEPEPALLMGAARHASRLADLPLAERLARDARAAGGGFEAQMLVVSALNALTRSEGTEAELATLTALAGTDAERVRATWAQVDYLALTAARPDEAEAVLDASEALVRDDDARLQLTAIRAFLDSELGRVERAAESATTALASPDLPDESAALAAFGLILALGASGRGDEIGTVAARGYAAAARSTELAYFRVPLALAQITGLRLAGYVDAAADVARERDDADKDLPFGAELTGYLVGETELSRGRLASAVRWLREARAGLAEFGNAGGWLYLCLAALTRALAISGDATAARQSLADLETERHPILVYFEAESMLARAWVAAADGMLSDAIAIAHEAAKIATGRAQLAHEVIALHTAVCFGDRTVADRLATLATRVDGPRAPAAAAHAAALAVDDGDALRAASVRLEQMGDLLSAVDAAARAAASYTRHGQRAPAHAATTRAQRLAEACGGARTPALAAATTPLPLTDREREIVTLAAAGMTNREIAERLVVSVRTVEGHLYRACAKLGTSNRAELATLLRGT